MKILIIVLSCLAFISCSKETDNGGLNTVVPPLDKSIVMPLKIGNYWIYKASILDTLKNVDTVVDSYVSITAEKIINSEKWYFQGDNYGFINRSNGLWYTINYDTTMVAKYPTLVNDRIPMKYDTARVISVDSIIQVPAGKFSCYVYKSKYEINCYSPGIGLIYSEIFYNSAYSDDFYIRKELKSYEFK